MKSLIIGGGKGCRSLLDLARGSFLNELKLDIIAVVDVNPKAPGMIYADEIGLETFTDMKLALDTLDIEVIIELTGQDQVLEILYKVLKPDIKLIDHTIARIFWDLVNVREKQDKHLAEMKNYETKLRKERHFLQSIFDNLVELAVVIDKNYNLIMINKNFAEHNKIRQDDAIGKKCYEVMTKNPILCSKKEYEESLEEIFRTGRSVTFHKLTPPPDENHWEIDRTPIKNEEGKVVAVLGTWHRITERVMLHREIESAEQKFKSFINSAKDWISIKDLKGRYLIVNPVVAEAFHLPPEYFSGKSPEDIFPGKLAETIMRHDKEVLNTKMHHVYDEIVPIDGQDHHFQTVRFPLADYKGEMTGVCTIMRDISKEIKLQDQLIQSEKLAALGKLAAGVAHEINNPLTGILAYAEGMMDEVNINSDHANDLKVIIRETLRCRDIVKNLLDFARQDKPKLELTDPKNIVSNSLHLIERLPQFRDITIEEHENDELPMIQADPMQIQQVLLNFMLNAADAMKYKGKINVYMDYDLRQGNCEIAVEDSGPGIPENLIDKIFEPFFSTKGTNGLGLAVSWGIIERHNGTIEIDISENGGAIFRILLPAFGQK